MNCYYKQISAFKANASQQGRQTIKRSLRTCCQMGLKQVGDREVGLVLARWAGTTGDGRELDAIGGVAEPSEYIE